MKTTFLKLPILLGLVFISSCSKDEIFIDVEPPSEQNLVNVPLTFKLYKESYYNQKSGIVFRWGDYRPSGQVSHSTKMGNDGGYFANGQSYHDVNKDGYQDILVTYHLNDNISSTDWYINSGDSEHFSKINLINSSTSNLSSHKILKTDVNNDNLADFILLGVDEREQGNFGGNFTTLLQKPNGTFDLISIDDGKGLWYHNGAAGDLNGDGFVDVVTADYLWYGDGTGNFTNSNIMVSEYYAKDALVYEIVDINKDGYNDILLGTASYRESTTIILGNENGFNRNNEKIKLVQLPNSGPMDMEIYDIDGDGDLDIIESRHTDGEIGGYTELYVYINSFMKFDLIPNYIPNSKDGNFTHGSRDKYGWSSFKIDDIDGDGIDDIVSENYSDGEYNGLKKINGIWKKYTFKFGK